jgi:cysteine sulfinate desulfinase/cysteine desulfurase-like protein
VKETGAVVREHGDVERNGHPTERLTHSLTVYLPGIESRALIVDLKETAIATGCACSSADGEPAHMITAMHDEPRAHSSICITVGRATDDEETSQTDPLSFIVVLTPLEEAGLPGEGDGLAPL